MPDNNDLYTSKRAARQALTDRAREYREEGGTVKVYPDLDGTASAIVEDGTRLGRVLEISPCTEDCKEDY